MSYTKTPMWETNASHYLTKGVVANWLMKMIKYLHINEKQTIIRDTTLEISAKDVIAFAPKKCTTHDTEKLLMSFPCSQKTVMY